MPAAWTGAEDDADTVALVVTGAGAAAAGGGVTAAGAAAVVSCGAAAALSGFATPELSGGVCAPATRGIITLAVTSIQKLTPTIRAPTPVLIAFSPKFRDAARCRPLCSATLATCYFVPFIAICM